MNTRTATSTIFTACAATALLFTGDALAQTRESWECKLDLHQGDTGTLILQRSGEQVAGVTMVTRGDQKHRINGNWRDETIRFRRLLTGNSVQDFSGVAISTSANEVRMAGRFASRFSGVWSADCVLQSREVQPGGVRAAVPPVKAQPLPLPVNPVKPAIKTEAETKTESNSGNCSIAGNATGSKAASSEAFFVSISGPDSDRFRDSQPFQGNRYRFTGLPEGRYTLSVDTRGDLPVSVNPGWKSVDCRGNGVSNVNFEFR